MFNMVFGAGASFSTYRPDPSSQTIVAGLPISVAASIRPGSIGRPHPLQETGASTDARSSDAMRAPQLRSPYQNGASCRFAGTPREMGMDLPVSPGRVQGTRFPYATTIWEARYSGRLAYRVSPRGEGSRQRGWSRKFGSLARPQPKTRPWQTHPVWAARLPRTGGISPQRGLDSPPFRAFESLRG